MKEYFYHHSYIPSMQAPERMLNIIDRSKALFDLPQIEIISPIGSIRSNLLSIDEICYSRAQEIVSIADSRYIFVCWSGGIDSTLALVEIMKLVKLEQLCIILDNNSILEYPDFYSKFIKDKVRTLPMSFYDDISIKTAIQENGIIITGGCFDHIFGSNAYVRLDKHILLMPLNEFLSKVNIASREIYIKLCAVCPRDITNVKELFWWLNYTLDYQNDQLTYLLYTKELILDKNIFHFGDSTLWNDYAISIDSEIKFSGIELVNYKMPLKRVIEKYTHDSVYTKHKLKVLSWRRYRVSQDNTKCLFIKTDWSRD